MSNSGTPSVPRNRITKTAMPVGELFILGFFGKTIPAWLREFAARYGLGGVILFDYSCQTQKYDNNIESPEQVQRLCEEISSLPSHPMVFIDQEGGLVRRLKESRGFKPLPSAKEFNHLALRRSGKYLPPVSPRCAASAFTTTSRRSSMSITTLTTRTSARSSAPIPPISARSRPMRCWRARLRARRASGFA